MNDAGLNSRSGLLLKDNLDKTSRERVKQARRDLLASIKTRLAELDRFWEKEQTKADVEVFVLDEVFARLPSPPFTPDEKKALAASVHAHVWQQAVNGGFAQAAQGRSLIVRSGFQHLGKRNCKPRAVRVQFKFHYFNSM